MVNPPIALDPAVATWSKDAALHRFTTLKVGGAAEWLVEVESVDGLSELLRGNRGSLPIYYLGQGANLLVPDEGLTGVVCRLRGNFRRFVIDGTTVYAGASVVLAQLARQTAKAGLVGLEALAGFPASVGGAVAMNAGCYGMEIRSVVERVELLDAAGEPLALPMADLEPGYRRTCVTERGWVVTAVTFALSRGEPAATLARMEELNRRRWDSLPSGKANAGSIFRNPEGDFAGRLLEEAGVKGLVCGGARISEKHANVIVNDGGATAAQVLELMLAAQRRVFDNSGTRLEPELVLLGGLRDQWRRCSVPAEPGGTSAEDDLGTLCDR